MVKYRVLYKVVYDKMNKIFVWPIFNAILLKDVGRGNTFFRSKHCVRNSWRCDFCVVCVVYILMRYYSFF